MDSWAFIFKEYPKIGLHNIYGNIQHRIMEDLLYICFIQNISWIGTKSFDA